MPENQLPQDHNAVKPKWPSGKATLSEMLSHPSVIPALSSQTRACEEV